MTDGSVNDRSAVVDLALDVLVYAPLGAAVQARRLIPELARVGREHLDQRLPGYRAVGELAVDQLKQQAGARLGAWVPGGDDDGPAPATDPLAGAPTAPSPPAGGEPPASAVRPAPDLPIDDYDELSAVQVLPNLTALDATELEAIAAHERANRSRRTILGRIDQLLEARG